MAAGDWLTSNIGPPDEWGPPVASGERLPYALEAAAVGFAQLSYGTRRFVSANPRMCAISGYTAQELCALSLTDLVHPDDCQAISAQYDRLMTREIGEFTAERRWIR